jgi:hypothetical protein
MPTPTHIMVTALPDRVTPIHKDDGIEPTGAQLRVTAGRVERVRYSQSIRRSIARGDLIPCNMSGAAVASVELATSLDEMPASKLVKETSK